jgi:hypothetical protein
MLNQYFNFQKAVNEQTVIENLIIEAIKMFGMDIIYVPKTLVDFDKLYGEDASRAFRSTYTVEAYMENAEGFMGDKNFLNKFGLNIDKQATFNVAKKRFDEVLNGAISRPQEGDLIYLPITHDIMEISFADHEEVFYQLGKIYVWKITCEKFRSSHEEISTGNEDIDSIAAELEGNDPLADNDELQQRIESFLDTSSKNPLAE